MQLPDLLTMDRAAARRAVSRLRHRAGAMRAQAVRRRAATSLGSQLVSADEPVEADVVVHFAEAPDRLYQLDQWLPVLERLAERHHVVLLLRHRQTPKALAGRTKLPVVSVTSYLDLMRLYQRNDFKLGIYVNNADRNFQSLSNARMLHVHVGHGDSDKLSSCSNQVKSYDRVLVAGPAAARRYVEALIDYDEDKLVLVGRPQLDLPFPDLLAPSPRRTVLYAPTWEGATDSNNWTSVDLFGTRIVEAALSVDDVRLVYKSHPRVPGSPRKSIARAHRSIVAQIGTANARDAGAGHVVATTGDILGMFAQSDALVGDVSSVSLDFLYARPECPIFLTDRRDDRALLTEASPLAQGADVLDSRTIGSFRSTLAARLSHDACRKERAAVRRLYFGDLGPGESMAGFLDEVDRLIATRDRLVGAWRPS